MKRLGWRFALRTFLCTFLCAFLCISVSSEAFAGAYDLFGVGARAQAMGGAMTAAADDWSAAYYNPALLTEKQTFSFGASFQLTDPAIKITTGNPSAKVTPPPLFDGIGLGLLFPIGGKVKDHVAVGLLMFVPGQAFVQTDFQDASVPHFYMYQSQPGVFQLFPTLGIRILDWLSIGGGVSLLASLAGSGNISLDIANNRLPLKELKVALQLNAAPVAGIAVKPVHGLSLGIAYRGQNSLPITLPVSLGIEGLDANLNLVVKGVTQWTPHTFDFGASYLIEPAKLRIAAALEYALWSAAPDPTIFIGVSLTGADVEKAGLSGLLDAPSKGNERAVDLAASNTLGVRAGLEYNPTWFFALRGGYNYRPTPLPLQTSGTNFLDSNVHTLSLGVGFQFRDPVQIFSEPIALDFTGQVGILESREHDKATSDDPVGNIMTSGAIWGFSVGVRYTFGP